MCSTCAVYTSVHIICNSDEVATRRSSGVLDDDGGATTGVVYPLLARMLCLGDVVRELVGGCSGFVCAAAEGLHSHRPSTFSADGIGGARSDGRLRDVCFGLRTVASAEQPNRREATSSLRWVLLDFLRSCFFVPLSPFVIASISLWYPDMTFGRGHTEDNDECVFLCATRYLVALKRDLSISHYLLQSDRCSSSSSFQLTRRLR